MKKLISIISVCVLLILQMNLISYAEEEILTNTTTGGNTTNNGTIGRTRC